MEYQHDIFYTIERLPYEERMKLVKEAMDKSESMFVDQIIGVQRQNVPDADPYEWIEFFPDPDSIFRFVLRRGYEPVHRIQVVINEMSHFLWINVNKDHLEHFIQKYKLTEI